MRYDWFSFLFCFFWYFSKDIITDYQIFFIKKSLWLQKWLHILRLYITQYIMHTIFFDKIITLFDHIFVHKIWITSHNIDVFCHEIDTIKYLDILYFFSATNTMIIPTVIDKTPSWERAYDIYSRLLEDRIIFFGEEVNHATANTAIAQLLYLEKKDPNQDIIMYINSPGWSVSDGFGIMDTMNFIKPDIVTVCTWLAASFGAMLLMAGKKWKRYMLKNAEVMIHQPLWWWQWQATDVEIMARQMLKAKAKLNAYIAEYTWQPLEKVARDVERDYWMSSEDAVEYGIVDHVLSK